MREITLGFILNKVYKWFLYLKTKTKAILLFTILGAFIGFLFSIYVPVKFKNKIVFVVEESKSSGSGISAIAGQFGIDIGGSGGGDFFSDENILLFLKSESLCREVLMSDKSFNEKENLADAYARIYNLKSRWVKKLGVEELRFSKYNSNTLPRFYDSLLQIIVRKHILKNDLFIYKTDKNTSFITIETRMIDENLTHLFSEKLLELATQKYIDSKIKVKAKSVSNLQRRADSLAALLETRTISSATSQQSLVDINPAFKSASVNPEISNREKVMVATIYGEVVKNLEISKTLLSQYTPSVQVIDRTSFPLEKMNLNILVAIFSGSLISLLVATVYLLLRKWIKTEMVNNKN